MIILRTHYGKLSFITTVCSPEKQIKIGIRYSESVQGSQVLSISWVVDLELLDPWSRVLGPHFRLCSQLSLIKSKKLTGTFWMKCCKNFNVCLTILWKLSASVNLFYSNSPSPYRPKISDNLWNSDASRGYRNGTLGWNGLQFFTVLKGMIIWYFFFYHLFVFLLF